jgi:aspartyl-tRNA(Asn)/glutamyl-tRNA(Gln) amidotransferase subunit C
MSLTTADVERIAALAHLELTPEEKTLFTKQLADILAYAQQLQSLDTSGVPATAHISAEHEAERDDTPRESLPVADVMANAPDGVVDGAAAGQGRGDASSDRLPGHGEETPAGLFRVPRVIG